MSDTERNWVFSEGYVREPPHILQARRQSLEYGVEAVSPGVGSQLAVLAASVGASNIVEIGTGLGVSALWMLYGAPSASLTSIDPEYEYHEHVIAHFASLGIPHTQTRFITSAAADVLPRLNESSYDLVFIDANPEDVMENFEFALSLARVGGLIVVAHALWHGEVAEPAKRGRVPSSLRSLLSLVSESDAVVSTLSPSGDGLLQMVRRA